MGSVCTFSAILYLLSLRIVKSQFARIPGSLITGVGFYAERNYELQKVLVIGCNGLLGQKAVSEFGQKSRVVGADLGSHSVIGDGNEYFRLDITDRLSLERVINEVKPEIVFNASAYTKVDQAEIEKELCYSVNAKGVGYLASTCAQRQIKLLHISTDYVFDGGKGNYVESDTANPINYYGQSKLDGEKAVLDSDGQHLIARTAVLFGNGIGIPINFANWVLQELRANKTISVVDDQIGNPTLADHLAQACRELLEKNANGLYHVAGLEPVSRFDFAVAIAEEFGLNVALISRVKTRYFKQLAKRPLDVGLDVSCVKNSFDSKMFSLGENLEKLKETVSEPKIAI